MKRNPLLIRSGYSAFTLVEMLVAMAVTLLLMAALAKSFGLVGKEVRVSRTTVDLNNRLRDVTTRLKDELGRCTISSELAEGEDQKGYLVYYDGPMSDATSSLFGSSPAVANEATLQDSRFGDSDDYLAFTAVAEGNNWFKGKVPRFVLDQKTSENFGVAYDPTNFPGSPIDPVVIRSKYAEIIYYAAPDYLVAPDSSNSALSIHVLDAGRNATIQDFTGNALPDKLRLHRRVLLIRPDLNLTSGSLPTWTDTSTAPSFTYLDADVWTGDVTTTHPMIKTPAIHGLGIEMNSRAWLIGMAPVHQQCDLSVRRTLNPAGTPQTAVAANSLEDLAAPHNRFAHVRIPSGQVGIPSPTMGTNGYTSMPLIALGGVQPIFTSAVGTAAPPLGASPAGGSGASVVTPAFLSGYLRPEFTLGTDLTHTDRIGDQWGLERLGEDVLISDVVGFDVKIFDATAQTYIARGIDNSYGIDSVDDDGDGTVDNLVESGFPGSDDRLVSANDVSYGEVLAQISSGATLLRGNQGVFVDLVYPFQAGGTLRGFPSIVRDMHGATNRAAIAPVTYTAEAVTDFSGFTASPSYSPIYVDGLFESGRIVTGTGGQLLIFQPAFDTYWNGYERDGFAQGQTTANANPQGTLWWLNSLTGAYPTTLPRGMSFVDASTNGLDDVTSAAAYHVSNSQGADQRDERETSAPFDAPLSALKVTVRIENQSVRQVSQMSMTEDF